MKKTVTFLALVVGSFPAFADFNSCLNSQTRTAVKACLQLQEDSLTIANFEVVDKATGHRIDQARGIVEINSLQPTFHRIRIFKFENGRFFYTGFQNDIVVSVDLQDSTGSMLGEFAGSIRVEPDATQDSAKYVIEIENYNSLKASLPSMDGFDLNAWKRLVLPTSVDIKSAR